MEPYGRFNEIKLEEKKLGEKEGGRGRKGKKYRRPRKGKKKRLSLQYSSKATAPREEGGSIDARKSWGRCKVFSRFAAKSESRFPLGSDQGSDISSEEQSP